MKVSRARLKLGAKKVLLTLAAAAAIACAASMAHAQGPFVPPTPVFFPNPTDNNVNFSAHAAQFDIGSSFLQRLGREAIYGLAARGNSGGGGASQSTADPLYRTWAEAYGISSHTAAQGTFVGDRRKAIGVVGGIGATIAPGLNVGFSADESSTRIEVPLALQSGTLGMTQIGVNASYTNGPWTLAAAAIHGFARISASRFTPLGGALSNYRGSIDGALAELNYNYAFGQSRIIPKVALEYMSARTDRYSEVGGLLPVNVAEAKGERARVLAGAEVGHYWIVGQQAIDVSAYGKFVDNFSQNVGSVQVGLANNNAISVQGIRESRNGADAGAAASWIYNNTVRFYANYDGKFRDGFQSHQATAGVELKW